METKTIISWVLTGLVVAFLLFDSIGKLTGMEQSVKATIGLGYSESSIFTIGVILVICTLLYIIPQTSVIGLILLTAYLGGAVASNARIHNPLFSHTLFPVYIALLAWAGLALKNEKLFQILINK